MKIYKTLSIFFLIALTSCSDFLEIQPANVLVVSTYSDVKNLMGAHIKALKTVDDNYLKQTVIPFASNNQDYMLFHFYSDDFDETTYLNTWMGRNNQGLFRKSLNWKNTDLIESIWTNYFTNIGFYNMIIEQIGKNPGNNATETNIVKGEAKVLRAWSFFKLLQYFSPYHENEYGLPINTDPEAVGTYDKSRKTQSENYNFIISELKEVLDYPTNPSDSYNLFYNKNIIRAILAQVYLYKGDSGAKQDGDYAKAIQYAQSAMAESGISYTQADRNPVDGDEYGTYTNKPYALLSFFWMESDRNSSIAGAPGWGMPMYSSQSLLDLYKDNDKRKGLFVADDRSIMKLEPKTFYYYFAKLDFFTAAELQLIIAESYARQGNESQARIELNNFANTRYTAYVEDGSKSVLQNILDERRREFCFEYDMRWTDLARLQKGWTRNALDKNDSNKTYTLDDGDYRFCFPIPLSAELSENNQIKQNPGWSL